MAFRTFPYNTNAIYRSFVYSSSYLPKTICNYAIVNSGIIYTLF